MAINIINQEGAIQLYNIYNDSNHHNTLTFIVQHLASQPCNAGSCAIKGSLLLGDFNRHHPLWDDPGNHHLFTAANMTAAQPLLDILATHGLCMAPPAYKPTLQANALKNLTRLDNVFCSDLILEAITQCGIHEELTPVKNGPFPHHNQMHVYS